MGSVRAGVFARNWSSLIVSNIGGQILGMIAIFRIARVLAPQGFGQYQLILTVSSIGAVAAGLGLRNVIMRECARHPGSSEGLLKSSLLARSWMLAVVSAGVLLYAGVSGAGLGYGLGAIAVGLLIAQTFWEAVENIAFGNEQMQFSAVINLAGATVWVSAAWLVPASWLTPFNVCVAFTVLQYVKTSAYFVVARRKSFFGVRISTTNSATSVRWLLRESLPFYWLAVMTVVSNQIPILLLAERSGQAQVGFFNAGLRLVNPMQMFILTALTVLYPGLSRSMGSDEEGFMHIVRGALTAIAIAGSSAAFCISLFREDLVVLLFGEAFRSAADAMAFQCWFTVMLGIFSVIGTVLAARDKQQSLAILSSIYTAVAIPFLWVGSSHGATGLAIAMILAAFVNFSYHWVVFQRSLAVKLGFRYAPLLIAISGAGAYASWIIPQNSARLVRLIIFTCVSVGVGYLAWLKFKRKTGEPLVFAGSDGYVHPSNVASQTETHKDGSRP